jgi:spoIIIJ-associated protein
MPSFVEIEGKNVEQALKNACEKLKISEENLKHEILSYGSSGIFGLVCVKKAKIRVIVPEEKTTSPAIDRHRNAKPETFSNLDAGDGGGHEEKVLNAQVGLTNQEIANFGKSVLEHILGHISPEAKVIYEVENSVICYNINGGHSGVLIGKRGQTLDAIQYILEKIINKQNLQKVRVQVDIEGYLENRKDGLLALAGRLSDKASKTGRPVTVGNMSSHDRRIVHLALKMDEKVKTKSIGDGLIRKLVIFPKGYRKNTNKID